MKKHIFILILFLSIVMQAQVSPHWHGGIRDTAVNYFTYVPPPEICISSNTLQKVKTASISVNYIGNWSDSAKASIDFVKGILEHLIKTNPNYTIKIKATLIDTLDSTSSILGAASPASFFRVKKPGIDSLVWYPVALAEMLLDTNLNTDNPEIFLEINSKMLNTFYFGTDGKTPPGKSDFASVVLHEIAHGLGFFTSFDMMSGLGMWGYYTNYSFSMDKFCNHGYSSDPQNKLIVKYPNPSIDLGIAIRSTNIFFTGSNARLMNNDSLPQFYAPMIWSEGSSMSHLDEERYFPGSMNSLMTPILGRAEAIHHPGIVGLAMMKDAGWEINRLITPVKPVAGQRYLPLAHDTLVWMDNMSGNLQISLLKKHISGNFVFVRVLTTQYSNTGQLNSFIWNLPSDTGIYIVQFIDPNTSDGYGQTKEFYINNKEQVKAPQISPNGGALIYPMLVSVSTLTDSAQIRYTFNGEEPDSNSLLVPSDKLLLLRNPCTLNVKAFKTGFLPSIKVSAVFTLSTTFTQINQFDKDSVSFGRISVYVNLFQYWRGDPSGVLYDLTQYSSNEIRALQSYKPGTVQKYHHWELIPGGEWIIQNYASVYQAKNYRKINAWFDSTVTGISVKNSIENSNTTFGSVKIKDPWIIRDTNAVYGPYNKGMVADFYEKNSPFVFSSDTNYRGVFLNQDFAISGRPFYSISTKRDTNLLIQQTGRNHKFTFQKWVADPSKVTIRFPDSLTTPVNFLQNNATVTAVFKGSQLSTTPGALTNNSQRKIIKSSDGYLHMVYESMNNIWYEMSTDNGVTWAIMNNGKGLSNNIARNPAIAFQQQQTSGVPAPEVVIAFEENISNNVQISVRSFRKDIFNNYTAFAEPVVIPTAQIYTNVTNPVIGCDFLGESFVVWREDALDGNGILNVADLKRDGDDKHLLLMNVIQIPGAGDNPKNPAIGSEVNPVEAGGDPQFNIVWENNSETIHYIELTAIAEFPYIAIKNNSHKILSDYAKPVNYRPSIKNGSHRVVWIESDGNPEDPETIVSFCDPVNPSHFWYFGSNISSPTITEQANGTYFFAWTQNESATMKNYWVDNTLSAANVKRIKYLNTADVQLTNSGTPTTCMAIGLGGQQAPYSFVTKPLVQTNNQNTTDFPVATAISGTVSYPETGGIKFDYTLGDISVDGSPVSFAEAAPDITFSTIDEMNQYLISQPFDLNNSSEFFYSIVCIPSHSTEYVQELFRNGGSLTFTVQLVDAGTGEIIGTYDNVVYDAANTREYRNIMFDVDCAGIGTRTVKLRLTITNTAAGAEPVLGSYIVPLPDGQIEKMMSKVKEDRISFWRNNGAVAKKTAIIKKVAFNGKALKGSGADAVITEYALDQNYPNPFNPATTISYQLPKAGIVTLKIYDMLGREIKVLVNEYKETGKYTAEFNGAGLASGVYVYRLDCNDFHATKKLTLLK